MVATLKALNHPHVASIINRHMSATSQVSGFGAVNPTSCLQTISNPERRNHGHSGPPEDFKAKKAPDYPNASFFVPNYRKCRVRGLSRTELIRSTRRYNAHKYLNGCACQRPAEFSNSAYICRPRLFRIQRQRLRLPASGKTFQAADRWSVKCPR